MKRADPVVFGPDNQPEPNPVPPPGIRRTCDACQVTWIGQPGDACWSCGK